MNNDYKITSTDRPFNMSAWCAEKSSKVGESVSKALDLVVQSTTLDAQTKEQLEIFLGGALYDISKLMSFSVGSEWSVPDARDIQNNGFEGYHRIAAKYGIIDASPGESPQARLETFCDSLSRLLSGTRSPNRTLVHELLSQTTLDHPIVEQTTRLIELVTMGQMQWPEFCTVLDASIHALNLPKQAGSA
jgi:hypothetical protein